MTGDTGRKRPCDWRHWQEEASPGLEEKRQKWSMQLITPSNLGGKTLAILHRVHQKMPKNTALFGNLNADVNCANVQCAVVCNTSLASRGYCSLAPEQENLFRLV